MKYRFKFRLFIFYFIKR